MIKCETLGMLDIAKINPVLTSASDVNNNSFLVGADGITYVIMNDISGDDAYKDDVTLKAGSYLNGYDVSAWVGQKLIVDGKHITGGVSGLTAGTSVLVIDGDHAGMLKAGSGSRWPAAAHEGLRGRAPDFHGSSKGDCGYCPARY